MIYLDHAASTPLLGQALKVLQQSYAEDFANPSSAHLLGKVLQERIEEVRHYFLHSLQKNSSSLADQGIFIFTSSATEANNLLAHQFHPSVQQVTAIKSYTLSTLSDHPSLTAPLHHHHLHHHHHLSSMRSSMPIPLDSWGHVDLQRLEDLLKENHKNSLSLTLFNLAHINNHSGHIRPLEEISYLVKKWAPQSHFHVDASQSWGKIPLDLSQGKILVDSISFSAHKMGGPKGIAGLYLSPHSPLKKTLKPLIVGGGQEAGARSSTLSAPLIFSWKEAVEEMMANQEKHYQSVQKLSIDLCRHLKEELPQIIFPFHHDCSITSDTSGFSPYILTFIIPQIPSDVIIRHLEEKNIFISSSSACSSRIKGKSEVFQALNIPLSFHKNVLRVSLAATTTAEDLQLFVQHLRLVVEELEFLFKIN